ncbi:hypothetical protein JOF53_007003 [Crossiella equi]|uniref:DUF4878 domain-containing protein n=1 Tax=Crossiella equi TaxID=130796 RepID=A0ABS5ANY7_9PSEU|nr:hypothetical protein [Crossiella equi]MBP2478131.1 hypothetical protein [Crossiella equi]
MTYPPQPPGPYGQPDPYGQQGQPGQQPGWGQPPQQQPPQQPGYPQTGGQPGFPQTGGQPQQPGWGQPGQQPPGFGQQPGQPGPQQPGQQGWGQPQQPGFGQQDPYGQQGFGQNQGFGGYPGGPKPGPNKGLIAGLAVAGVVVLVGAIGGGVYLFQGDSPTPQNTAGAQTSVTSTSAPKLTPGSTAATSRPSVSVPGGGSGGTGGADNPEQAAARKGLQGYLDVWMRDARQGGTAVKAEEYQPHVCPAVFTKIAQSKAAGKTIGPYPNMQVQITSVTVAASTGIATVKGDRGDGKTDTNSFSLVKEGSDWKICE